MSFPRTPAEGGNDASGVSSPCVGVCRMVAATGWCEGCHRTLDEIAAWSAMDDQQRLAVRRLLSARRALKASRAAAKI